MKQLLFVAVLLCGSITAIQAQDQKLGHTNIQELLMLLPERADAEKKIQNLAQTLEKRLKAMTSEYQQKVQAYQNDQGEMSATIRESEARSIMELEQRINEFQQNAQNEIQQKENELLEPMINRLTKAIEQVGKEHNFMYILDTSSGTVLYKGGEDVTPLVKAHLEI
ncbi:MAG: OmpH family outer membrane protein [Cryomorphaceae bacterium]|nr:MAG: OmpH family outer membrane protein [Cryomorphaceae bacterium]